jgi:hypothetical protein
MLVVNYKATVLKLKREGKQQDVKPGDLPLLTNIELSGKRV